MCEEEEEEVPLGVKICDESECIDKKLEEWDEQFDEVIWICDDDDDDDYENTSSKSSSENSSTKTGEAKAIKVKQVKWFQWISVNFGKYSWKKHTFYAKNHKKWNISYITS